MTQEIKVILSSMLRTSGSTSNIDRFRETFGSWQIADFGNTTEIKYVKNINRPYEIGQFYAGQPDVNMFIVPTSGNTSIPFIEQIYRKQTFKISRIDNSYPTPQSLIPFNYRFTNLAMEGSTRSIPNPGTEPNIQIPGLSTTSIDFVYKAENIQFEELATTVFGQERALPNYYDITLWNREISTNNDLYSFLRDSLDKYYADPLKNSKNSNLIVPCDNVSLINEGNSYINETKQNIFNSHEILDGVATRENTFSQIPYYVHIKLSDDVQQTNPTISVSGERENTKFIRNNIMFFPKESLTPLDLPDEKSYDNNYDLSGLLSRWHLQNKNIINLNENLTYRFSSLPVGSGNFYTYELVTWLNQYAPSVIASLPNDMNFIGLEETACSRMIQPTQTKMVLVQYALKKILNAFSRIDLQDQDGNYQNFLPQLYSPKDMLECGGMGTNETLFYKIEKFIGSTTSTTPLQTVVIPHSDLGTEYIDTQVSYDSQYTYRISEIKAVLYCEYEYRINNQFFEADADTSYIDILQYPRIKIIEIPIHTRSGRILANPPNTPEIKILPVRKSKDKFRILFQNLYGTNLGDTNRLLLQNNQVSYTELLNRPTSQPPKILLDDKVSITSFHIFYTTEDQVSKMVSHQDLLDNQLYSVLTQGADSATIKISIKPNKKYFLSFVSLNRLGLASPGTDIYEFKLISDSGMTYLDFKPYVFDTEKEIYKYSKSANKLISISPSGLQGLINIVKPDPNEPIDPLEGIPTVSKNKPISFGDPLTDKLFPEAKIGNGKVTGKKIKVRIKSNHTNEMFDINLQFKHERVESIFDKSQAFKQLQIDPVENLESGASEVDLLTLPAIPMTLADTPYPCTPSVYNYIDFRYPETSGKSTIHEVSYIPDPGYGNVSYPDPSTPLPTPPGISGVYPPTQGLDLLFDPNDPNQRVQQQGSGGNTAPASTAGGDNSGNSLSGGPISGPGPRY